MITTIALCIASAAAGYGFRSYFAGKRNAASSVAFDQINGMLLAVQAEHAAALASRDLALAREREHREAFRTWGKMGRAKQLAMKSDQARQASEW